MTSERQMLLLLAILATVAFIALLSPMRSVLIWAAALAVIFGPRNEKLAQRWGNRSLAAAVTVLIAVVTVMLPIALVAYFSREQFYEFITGLSGLGANLSKFTDQVEGALRQTIGIDVNLLGGDGEQIASARLAQVQQMLESQILRFGGAAATEIIELLSTLYILFFFLRDWRLIMAFMSNLVPLKPEHKNALAMGTVSVVNATLRGTIIVAALQAGVAGLFYLALGVDSWALLAVVTFAFCLMPAIGSGAVWVPLSLYFLFTGQIAHFWIMILGGFLVIGMIDNFLRPTLIGQQSSLPDFIIFLVSFGGLFLLGIDGLLLGPVVAKLFILLWELYANDNARQDHATQ